MDEFLLTHGWSQVSACGCVPKRYKWKNPSLPDHRFETIPTRQMWHLYEYDTRIRHGQNVSLESQYNAHFAS